ncbi:LLM class F420-dependent oxidoreductase [Novosphingobium sp. G106]|uniref:LLM class F420-dependent oxidoreductase n=1 Tax=Novosphingobium sp. G106 TaxID=2849500 RepID=UPI001C2D55F2|nr:LLM class F420-dependent oxidoreductase [Novosphingobium sp. G106]MBV1688934.1 LLM class F420-dependent oxidoreductase [Novosphingobium sp. G106]
MKLALGLGYSGARMALPVDLVIRAERLGFDSVWASETYGSDAITPLAYLAAKTHRIRLGTGIAQLAARTPANLAMCAQTIDALAGAGRMIIGLGMSGPQIVEGWYGMPWGKPNYRMRDYVAIMRAIWGREGPVSHQGKEISLPYMGPGSSGLGKPLKSILHGNPNIPVYLGTQTPLNIRMTAEVADGWLPMGFVPSDMPRYRPLLEEGLARRKDGKAMADFDIHGSVGVRITDDVAAALKELKPGVALYVGGMGAQEKNFHREAMIERGYPEAAMRIQELFLSGRKEEAADAVPDEYVDMSALVGPPDRIRERWKAWADSGLTALTLNRANEDVVELIAKIAL